MLFSVTLMDRPDGAALRAETAARHREYVARFLPQIVLGGPLLAADGETMIGSQIIIDMPDVQATRAFVENEPYNRAGLFEQVQIRRFRSVASNPELIRENQI
ncbi:YciI family protein [Hoeflea poritis]|uniref:YciI family protein n=1 Tax=Hoeflea poritis TaxID=2993659 RepID=A0ABT4VV43_9HYPH|nr:YciI family protein [Hoeflea poritis]MDA4848575.1 YciI family protein [Hoeflea poritis]